VSSVYRDRTSARKNTISHVKFGYPGDK